MRSNLLKQFIVKNDPHQEWQGAMNMMGSYVLQTVKMHGVQHIQEAHTGSQTLQKVDPVSGKVVSISEPVIFTKGSNFQHVLELPFVDETRTYTTALKEIQNVLGIEACYQAIAKFMHRSIDSQGSAASARHSNLIARFMTHRGKLVALQRHDLNSIADSGWLAKVSFEES